MVLPNGKKLKYILSGHLQFWLTIILMGHAIPMITETAPNSQIYAVQGFSPLKLSLLYDHYVQLISVSTVGAFVLSFYLYFSSFSSKDQLLAKGGNTGNAIYDFFIGKYRHLCSFYVHPFIYCCLTTLFFSSVFLPYFLIFFSLAHSLHLSTLLPLSSPFY